MAGHKGHAPGEASRAYKIKGAKGTSRKLQPTARQAHNEELRTPRCVGCGRERKPRSGPFCPDCSATNTERN